MRPYSIQPAPDPDLLAYPDACLCARLSMVELRKAIADGLIRVRALRMGGRTVKMVERRSLEAHIRGRSGRGMNM